MTKLISFGSEESAGIELFEFPGHVMGLPSRDSDDFAQEGSSLPVESKIALFSASSVPTRRTFPKREMTRYDKNSISSALCNPKLRFCDAIDEGKRYRRTP